MRQSEDYHPEYAGIIAEAICYDLKPGPNGRPAHLDEYDRQ